MSIFEGYGAFIIKLFLFPISYGRNATTLTNSRYEAYQDEYFLSDLP